jgi:uncharacterized protein DUF2255
LCEARSHAKGQAARRGGVLLVGDVLAPADRAAGFVVLLHGDVGHEAVGARDALYVRAAYGANTGWRGVARASHRASIHAGGLQKDVTIEDADQSVLDQVDAAYGKKYGGRYASIVDSITDAEHRATTLRLIPQEGG